jgi:hypothetical protein
LQPLHERISDAAALIGYAVRMSNVTRLLEAAQRGDRKAASDLLPLVFDELRQIAAARMAEENGMILMRRNWR